MNKTAEEQISGFLRNAQENIKAAYLKGYSTAKKEITAEAQENEYRRGLNDAEKAVKRVVNEPSRGGLYANEMQEIFGTKGTIVIFLKYSISEIIEKIREYDERKQQKICIGDEVYCLDKNHKSIVVGFTNKNLSRCLVMSEQGFLAMDTDTLHKTGRTYPVKEMFEKLNESEE